MISLDTFTYSTVHGYIMGGGSIDRLTKSVKQKLAANDNTNISHTSEIYLAAIDAKQKYYRSSIVGKIMRVVYWIFSCFSSPLNRASAILPTLLEREASSHALIIAARHDGATVLPPLSRIPPNWARKKSRLPWPTVDAISIIADHLCTKHNTDDLYVCESLEAFRSTLQQIDAMQQDTRLALLVTSYQPVTCRNKRHCHDPRHAAHDYHNQHKVPVFIEKKNGFLSICIFDSFGARMNMQNTHLDVSTNFASFELVYGYIRDAQLTSPTHHYTANLRRQWGNGCETFALRDSIAFLKTPSFFDNIHAHGMIDIANEDGSINNPFYINNLPPEFTKSTQSTSMLASYIKRNRGSRFYDLTQQLGTSQRTLEEHLQKHTIKVGNKRQNRHISNRVLKYLRLLKKWHTEKSVSELLAARNRRLIRV